jgi:hypothetical protein
MTGFFGHIVPHVLKFKSCKFEKLSVLSVKKITIIKFTHKWVFHLIIYDNCS